MKVLVELCRLYDSHSTETLTRTVFFFRTHIHYEVHYLPDHLHFNLNSYGPHPIFLHTTAGSRRFRRSFLAFLSRTLIPEPNFYCIVDSVLKKVNSVVSQSCYSGCYFVVSFWLSIRAIQTERYNLEAEIAWDQMLSSGVDPISRRVSGGAPATEKSVGELETVAYSGGGDYCRWNLECAICFKEFEEGEEIKRLPCFHLYHGECIDKWLRKSHLCPCCQFPLPVCEVVEGVFPFYGRLQRGTPAAVDGRIRRIAHVSVVGSCLEFRKP